MAPGRSSRQPEFHNNHLDFLLPEQNLHQQLDQLLHGPGQQGGTLPHSPEGLVQQRARGRQLRDPCSFPKVSGGRNTPLLYDIIIIGADSHKFV